MSLETENEANELRISTFKECFEKSVTFAVDNTMHKLASMVVAYREAGRFDEPNDTALRAVIPGHYIGQSLKGAAADYIGKLKAEIADLKAKKDDTE